LTRSQLTFTRTVACLFLLVACCIPVAVYSAPPVLTKQPVATGLDLPIFATAPKGDTTRLFIVELPGRIRLVKNGVLQTEPFLDITELTCDIAENGLLGLAFDPDYNTNGYFYVSYNDSEDCNLQISRFTRSTGNPDIADTASEESVMLIDQPDEPNHNGGSLLFGPTDGLLYIPTGDGTCCGDPFLSAQDSLSPRGKILRIDVSTLPYTIPPSNPYLGASSALDEIWAMGLRNPYRSSIDRLTGDFYIADVGQNTWEEVSFLSAATPGGTNFGWPIIEARHCYNPSDNCDSTGLRFPIAEYEHVGPYCSVTGGFVYRGCAMPSLQGYYMFGDFCAGEIWVIKHDGDTVTEFVDVSSQIGVAGGELSGFGEDAAGELYVAELFAGVVSKIVPAIDPIQSCPPVTCCVGIRGNVNGVGGITVADLTFLVQFLFNSGAAPPCVAEANVNGIGGITVADLTYLVQFLFNSGAQPPACP
jgi:glucose/arabinose dehydrogenase